MLAAFPDAYKAIVLKGGGPKMTVEKAAEAVFGAAGPGLTLYTGAIKAYPELLPAYRYHFLTNSKPATHLAALMHLTRKELRDGMPEVLAKVLKHVEANVRRD
jgi:putative ATP-dependent endonuclease of OLD family